jgi:hypothetical protein
MRRYMQRDVEFEVDAVDKSGGFIGAMYVGKTENVAITLVREGLATVHAFSAEGVPWVKQLFDAEVGLGLLWIDTKCLIPGCLIGRGQGFQAQGEAQNRTLIFDFYHANRSGQTTIRKRKQRMPRLLQQMLTWRVLCRRSIWMYS